jgi:hypothetical protein
MYAAREREWATIVRLIAVRDPKVACDGHDLVWREDLISGIEIAHNSPMP